MMLELLVIWIAIFMMAKRKPQRRRAMGRYLRGSVDEDLVLGGLASKTVISVIFDETVNERTLVSSVVAAYSLAGWTLTTNDGPMLVGLAHSDYSDAEIEEFVEATGSWNEGDLVQQEISKRKIRRIGIFEEPDTDTDSVTLNDGKPIKTKMNWIVNQGQTLRVWAYNLGAGPITTGASIHVQGHANLFPK